MQLRHGLLSTLILALFSSAKGQEDKKYGIYKSSAMVSITWTTDQVVSFQTEEVYAIEKATTLYFSGLLADESSSAFKSESDIISTSVQARKQKIGNDYVILESVVEVMNIGEEGMLDVAGLLMFLTNKNTTDSTFAHLDKIVDIGYNIDMISFTTSMESSELVKVVDDRGIIAYEEAKHTTKERTLVTVTIIVAFALCTISLILVWVAGGWLALRKRVKYLLRREEEFTQMRDEIKSRPTEDTDTGSPESGDMTNPSGILGVNPRALDGMGVKMTPVRGYGNGDTASDVFTPGSQATSYSDTGRIPLGITSMRKLIPGRGSPDYDQELAERNSPQLSYESKRLDYQSEEEERDI
ncbi:unnamed protein product [Cylindrotheca closterium]|uniref:Uncharacterized protein n=1 Tax=Cylindrotheca closterium TaxID=2856 RepID=A0AAD2CCA1_9STRA|nr:unnamed protein product [Cylindrotheca closterium]